jgi:hypothetical protein
MSVRMDSFDTADAASPAARRLVRGRWAIYVVVTLMVVLLAARDRVAVTGAVAAGTSSTAQSGDPRDALLLPTH